jgi:hypothetical protein
MQRYAPEIERGNRKNVRLEAGAKYSGRCCMKSVSGRARSEMSVIHATTPAQRMFLSIEVHLFFDLGRMKQYRSFNLVKIKVATDPHALTRNIHFKSL